MSNLSIAALSIVVIVIGLMDAFYRAPDGGSLIGAVPAALASLFVLVFSLMDSFARFGLKADRLQRCAERLSSLQHGAEIIEAKTRSTQTADWAALELAEKEYSGAIDTCAENHSDIDHKIFVAQHRQSKEFSRDGKVTMGWFIAAVTYIRYRADSVAFCVFSWFVVAGVLWLAATGHFFRLPLKGQLM